MGVIRISMATSNNPQNSHLSLNLRAEAAKDRGGHLKDSGFPATALLRPRMAAPPLSRALSPEPRQPRLLPPARFYRFRWKDLIEEVVSFYPLNLKNISQDL